MTGPARMANYSAEAPDRLARKRSARRGSMPIQFRKDVIPSAPGFTSNKGYKGKG